ncbi:MAG: N-acetylmuramoyl-L-alanine amidase [Anaerobacillus sp.]
MIIIDAGHGGSDPGAHGNGVIEKDWTLEVSLHQYEFLRKLGIPCMLTRKTDVALPSEKRSSLVKHSGASVCISNHYNAGGGSGAEVIHSIYSKSHFAEKTAVAIEQAGMPIRRVFSRKGADERDYYYMHRLTGTVETLIVEYGFLDSAVDMKKLKVRSFRLELAEEAALAAVKYSRVVPSLYIVQAGAYNDKKKAEKRCEELKEKGYEAIVKKEG